MKETEKCQIAMKLQTTHTGKTARFRTVKSSVITVGQQDAKWTVLVSSVYTEGLITTSYL